MGPSMDERTKPETSPDSESAIIAGLSLAIHEHRLAPGTKLSEDEVGEIYGVSRTVVRAALRQLAHDQLVTIRRNRGAYVAQPSVREAREVFEARALLEPRTARSAAERATPADLARLSAHIQAEHAALAAGEPGRAVYLSGMFHIEIARIADQETILAFIRQLRLFTQAESLGGIESLVAHPATMTHASVPRDVRLAAGVTDGLIRFSVGIEHVEDLWEDIAQALEK